MLRDEVAAGLGAFSTDTIFPLILISKSCSKIPSLFINCALIPAGPLWTILEVISGIIFCKLFTKINFERDLKTSPEVIRIFSYKFSIPIK